MPVQFAPGYLESERVVCLKLNYFKIGFIVVYAASLL